VFALFGNEIFFINLIKGIRMRKYLLHILIISLLLLIFLQFNSIARASSFIKIKVNNNVSFQLPRNWVVLSDDNVIILNSLVKSTLSVRSNSNIRFQANLTNNKGEPLTTVQVYSLHFQDEPSQSRFAEMSEDDLGGYDQMMHEQLARQVSQFGGRVTDWYGTRKQYINGLVALTSEYSRSQDFPPVGHARVQIIRVYSGKHSFSFVISYYEEAVPPLRSLVDEVVSTLRCLRCEKN